MADFTTVRRIRTPDQQVWLNAEDLLAWADESVMLGTSPINTDAVLSLSARLGELAHG